MVTNGDILVVEDSRFQAKRLRDFLEKNGYRVKLALNGKEGLSAARSEKPALIISDIMMPVMDGFEMCRLVKGDKQLKDVPVILLTSLSHTGDILRGLEAGADSYISKPCEGKMLLARIQTVVSSPVSDDGDASKRKLQVILGRNTYVMDAGRQQILQFLLSTYQDAIVQNRRLEKMREKLVVLNEKLEKMVAERTAALRKEIAERKQAQAAVAQQAEELARSNTELARSNAELAQFAYVASHDLQEPLRMVGSYTQLLAKRYKGKLDADADEFINFAVDGVVRMKSLINDLLDYSRVGTRGKELTSTDCEQIVAYALANLQGSIEECAAVVTHDPLPKVVADARQLGQLFQNLIGNAVKFRGEKPPTVHLGVKKEQTEWIFCVRDNGIGIDTEHIDRIFEIFQRLHSRAEYPGTGIGLAICKKIVERHGGRIWVESQPGAGSTFYFTIPIKTGGPGENK